MKKIMVATDGSESAAAAEDAAIELAQQMGAKLHVLAVRPPVVHGRAGSGPAMTEIEELHGSDHIAEEAARRLPVQLLFPLVLCVLPAFVLLAVVPLLLAAVPQLPH